MKKIPTLFERDPANRSRVTEQVTPDCGWVIAGEGIATRKWDGMTCLVRSRQLFKRYDAKVGRIPPTGFEPCEPAPDAITGHWPSWFPVSMGSEDRWFRAVTEVISRLGWPSSVTTDQAGPDEVRIIAGFVPDGTYELCGPRVNGNPEGFFTHTLVRHGLHELSGLATRTVPILSSFLAETPIEGIVFYHPDGRMAKIKRRDFDLPWPLSGNEALRLTRLPSHTTRLLPERE